MTNCTNELIKNKCCICGPQRVQKIKTIGEHQIVRCLNCKLIFLEEYPDTLFKFLSDSKPENQNDVEFWSFPNLYQKYKQVFDDFFKERLTRIEKYSRFQKKEFLDIGIGFGLWAKFLIKNGYKGEGFDISPESIKYCKSQDLTCEENSVENFSTTRKYSLICMFDVLEHLENPVEVLQKIKKMMHNDSLLYIQVPNVIGFKFPYNHSLGLPYHLWQFDRATLKKLLAQNGFEILEDWTGIQGVIGKYEQGGPSTMLKVAWKIANFFKIGNRIQIIVKKTI